MVSKFIKTINEYINEGYIMGHTVTAPEELRKALEKIKHVSDFKEYGNSEISKLKKDAMEAVNKLKNAILDEIQGNTNSSFVKSRIDDLDKVDGEEYIPGKGWRKTGPWSKPSRKLKPKTRKHFGDILDNLEK